MPTAFSPVVADRVCSGRDLLQNDEGLPITAYVVHVRKVMKRVVVFGEEWRPNAQGELVRVAQSDIDWDHEEYDR